MMMHPDDFDKILRIFRVITLVIILSYSFKLGQSVFHLVGGETW